MDHYVTVIIPTRNESRNILPLLARLKVALEGISAEVCFVDDSDDETPKIIAKQAAFNTSSFTVRLIHRLKADRGDGLGGAVLTGLKSARGEWVVVMDGDLQHPPELVPLLCAAGETAGVSAVVASRYRDKGDAAGLGGKYRHFVSEATGTLTRIIFPKTLKDVSDPMSGLFAILRKDIKVEELKPYGFKILLEILVRSKISVTEIPFTFAKRHAGESKASLSEGIKFFKHLLKLRFSFK